MGINTSEISIERRLAHLRFRAERRYVELGRPNAPGRSAWVEQRRRRVALSALIDSHEQLITSTVIAISLTVSVGVITSFSLLPVIATAVVVSGLLFLRNAEITMNQYTVWWYDRALAAWSTARALSHLENQGWVILHDRAVPGCDVRIDHLAIGPGGVWVITSERSEGRVARLPDGWWYVSSIRRRHIERLGIDLTTEAGAEVVAALQDVMQAHGVDGAYLVLAVWTAKVLSPGMVIDGVAVVPGHELAAMLATTEVRLSPEAVQDIAAMAKIRLPEVLLGKVLDLPAS
jgi:hypothetical protein